MEAITCFECTGRLTFYGKLEAAFQDIGGFDPGCLCRASFLGFVKLAFLDIRRLRRAGAGLGRENRAGYCSII